MKKVFVILLFGILLVSCVSVPKNFTYLYENIDTGLGKRIDIEGYYVSQHGTDTVFYSMFMFYSDGLFSIATTSQILPELIDCFANGGSSKVCKYPLWGTYVVEEDIIRTQTIRPEGGGCIIFRDYKILPTGAIVNISDYVEPQYTKLGYMENYPSFEVNNVSAKFFPLERKRSIADCPFVNKGWFVKEK